MLGQIRLEQDRFGFEPEVTAKIGGLAVRVCELPIHYNPRTAKQGKKIGMTDGFQAIACIRKYAPAKKLARMVKPGEV